MTESDVAFVLEAIDNHWAYKLRSKKGQEFWLCRDTRRLPQGEVGFTLAEFVELSKLDDPWIAVAAKLKLTGAVLTSVEKMPDAISKVGRKPDQATLW